MNNLPTKQSAFSRIRNSILNAGLRNKTTRSIMANALPHMLAMPLIEYTINNGEPDFKTTFELLGSMGMSAVKSNFSTILYALENRIRYMDFFTKKEEADVLINKMLDKVSGEVAEYISLKMINSPGLLYESIKEETEKRIADTIDCSNKTTEEINKILEVKEFESGFESAPKIAIKLFENLTPEQKKTHFEQFIPMALRGSNSDLSKMLEQFSPEDRLEQYSKILDVYSGEEHYKNALSLSICFSKLTMEDRVLVANDTFRQIEGMSDTDKVQALSNVISKIPSQEKDKYHRNILNYCTEDYKGIKIYVSSLDKKQKEEIVYDVISKLSILKDSSRSISLSNINYVLESFDTETINSALINVLNGNVNTLEFKFAASVLDERKIRESLIKNTSNNLTINPKQLELASKLGIDIEGLTWVCVNLECDRIVQEFLKNPDEKLYQETIQQIKELANNVKINDKLIHSAYTKTSESILLKKENAYNSIFYSLDDEAKGKYFEETIDAMLSLSNSDFLNENFVEKIKEFYEALDDKSKVARFPEIMGKLYERNAKYSGGAEIIDSIWTDMPTNVTDGIYELCTNMINTGDASEQYQTIVHALGSEEFKKGLVKYISEHDNISFLTEEFLENILENKSGRNQSNNEIISIIEIYTETRLNKIVNNYDISKDENIDSMLIELSKTSEIFAKYGSSYMSYASVIQIQTINKVFSSLDKDKKDKHFKTVCDALNNIKDYRKAQGYILIFDGLDDHQKEQRFSEILEQLKNDPSAALELFYRIDDEQRTKRFPEGIKYFKDSPMYGLRLFSKLDDKIKGKLFEDVIIPSPDNNRLVVAILKGYSIKHLNEIFKGKLVIDEEKIMELISLDPQITMKTLLFDKEVDREKIIDLDSYEQLKNNEAIDINSVIQNLYTMCQGRSKQEFNQLLTEAYNLFTYNNVPEFMKNFRIFQLSAYYEKQNEFITSFQGKTNEERDSLILEDLFKISLDSNNESLRDFANIILEGKQITTKIQSNPEQRLKTLSDEEIALLNQYRDTLFDLHNLTREIRKTDRLRIEKTGDVLKDMRTLISIYSNNQEHNPNSKNIVFNPNKIMDELFDGFITTTIRPKAILEYMDRRKAESDERHLRIEQQLRDGTMHLESGDFIKGIVKFDDYIPSMLRDGVKGGEFNQEHSHTDLTPLDADFGYISKANLTNEGATDYEIIETTVSCNYGEDYIVLKQYADRLQDRASESFDQGTFTGAPDYYAKTNSEDDTHNDRYIRTGIPVTDIDYIVSKDWNPKNGYEMAMAGIYIPVINTKGELVFTSEQYNRIREEMRGLSHYGADNIIVSKDATNMEALYTVYRNLSKKTTEEIDTEIGTVKGLVDGKTDVITEQKKNATTRFIRAFFKSKGIRVTDDLSQNLASQSVELIDTGSTGRGTNVPGDGDFDFMLRHNLPPEIIAGLTDAVKTLQTSESQFISVGDGFRTKNVTLPTGEAVDIDVTTAKKSLALSYSSDMCVRDRLENIRENSPESYNYVKANIIMAKKILKAAGIYKKLGSDGATEHGGFGGIGVENWILQNGGSFKTAIDTFLEAAKESDSYDEFKKKYPIFDFGFNHREGKIRHDRFSAFFENDPNKPGVGFEYAKTTLTEIQKTMELEMQKQAEQQMQSSLIRSISPEGFEEAGSKRSVLRNKFSYSRVRGMVSKFMASPESDRVQTALEEV